MAQRESNMKYIYVDGDNIGLLIENCFLNNDEHSLKLINELVHETVNRVKELLISENNTIIFCGADGIIGKAQNFNGERLLEKIRMEKNHFTFSFGIGESLRESYVALRYAKANGKDIGAELLNNEFIVYK